MESTRPGTKGVAEDVDVVVARQKQADPTRAGIAGRKKRLLAWR
jgi:hypothetical protein